MGIADSFAVYWAALEPARGRSPLGLLTTGALLARARRRHGIGPVEFLMYGLADRPPREWPDFITESEFRKLALRLTPPEEREIANDKLRFAEHCAHHGIRTVPLLGRITAAPGAAPAGDSGAVPDLDAHRLEELLRSHDELFFKRIEGAYGEGAFRARWENGRVVFEGRSGSASDLIDFCRVAHGGGYLVQALIRMHPDVVPIMSRGVGTARVITCTGPASRAIIGACLRITVGDNVTDNFVHGSSGNLIAGIDLTSGRLFSCFRARDASTTRMVPVEHHPDTGTRIIDRILPGWADALDLVDTACASLPGLAIVGWDVAFTTEGPVLLEANARPGLQGLQVALRRGIRPDLRAVLGPDLGRRG